MLKLERVVAKYGHIEALKGIDLQVSEGEIVTMIGGNGAGKTTTLATISGIVRAVSGQILFLGRNIERLTPVDIVKLGIVQSPEGRQVFPDLTVEENLMLGAYVRTDRVQIQEDLEHYYELFPRLKERHRQIAGTLSGGEQQMLAIARALMARPVMLLLDEPSLGLAPMITEQIFEKIQYLNQQENLTVLLIEQNAHLALSIAHRGYVIETGNIVLTDNAADLLHNEDVRKAYLGEN